MDDKTLSSLIDFARSVNLQEMVWEQGDQKIAFRRRATAEPAPKAATTVVKEVKPAEIPKPHGVRSPMVGTFRRASSKDRPPLVVEGGQVTVGQKLAIVEAMKIPKDVISDANGKIIRILVENGKPVEYGQKIFEIEVSPS